MKIMLRLSAMVVFAAAAANAFSNIAETAAVYFPFEGEIIYEAGYETDPNVGLSITAPCLANKGTRGFGELPLYKGAIPSLYGGKAPVITEAGLKGQALDCTPMSWVGITPAPYRNTFLWGEKNLWPDGVTHKQTALEEPLTFPWSFTITGWFKGGRMAGTLLSAKGLATIGFTGGKLYVIPGTVGTRCDVADGAAFNAYSPAKWVFFAVTYDGTVPYDSAGVTTVNNLRVYRGSETEPVALIEEFKAKLNNAFYGRMIQDGSSGSAVSLANLREDHNSAYEGFLDEIRIFAGGPRLDVLSLEELEQVRLYDLPVTTNCASVLAHGGGLAGDIDKDCDVDIADIESLSDQWLNCNNPQNEACLETW